LNSNKTFKPQIMLPLCYMRHVARGYGDWDRGTCSLTGEERPRCGVKNDNLVNQLNHKSILKQVTWLFFRYMLCLFIKNIIIWKHLSK